MDVKVCKNCRRLFKYIYGPELCQDCTKLLAQDKQEQSGPSSLGNHDIQRPQKTIATLGSQNSQSSVIGKTLASPIKPVVKDEESKFEQVRDYIMMHPRASVAQISEANDIPPTKLFEWIKADRLEFADGSEYAWFHCEKCGVKIKSGRLCNRCKTK